MAVITVRNVDDGVKQRLRVLAAQHGRSMEAEVRAIILEAVGEEEEPKDFFTRLHEALAEIGGVDLELPERNASIRIVDFD
jgi:plasmid stability protein